MPPAGVSLANVPWPKQAGTWGVAPGAGLVASVIRHATESWAGHAVMYVGGGKIVQARWPKVQVSDAPYQNIIWANGQPLTAIQRTAVCARAMALVGDGYDILVYPFLVAAFFNVAATRDATSLFTSDRWWDCSGLVEECDSAAGAPMFSSSDSAHFVTPAQLMVLGAKSGWFTKP
jgi:hypothetical protein